MQVPFARDNYLSEVPVNWYPGMDDDKKVILYGTPGLISVVELSGGEVRGMRKCGTSLYVVVDETAYKIDPGWIITEIGLLDSNNGYVWIEYNGLQVAFCDGIGLYVYTVATAVFAKVTDPDFNLATSLTYQDGYGIFTSGSQFWITGLYDFSSVGALDYASAEGWPDTIVATIMDYREIWLFGEETTEVWYNSGAAAFPFARREGGFVEQGCIAPASVAKGDNVIFWLANTRQVMKVTGYQPSIISTRNMESEIEEYTRIDDARSWVETFQGHTFYWLAFPTANATWVYDAATQVWHKRASYPNQGRHRANCYAYFEGNHLVGDYGNGKIYRMDRGCYDDDGVELVAAVQSPEIRSEGKRQFFAGLEVQFARGSTYLAGRDPQAMLQWSDDSGNNWSNELWANMGNLGEYRTRTMWRRLGSSYNRIFSLKVSDPVCRDILSVNWL